jgi:hypothetical protein
MRRKTEEEKEKRLNEHLHPYSSSHNFSSSLKEFLFSSQQENRRSRKNIFRASCVGVRKQASKKARKTKRERRKIREVDEILARENGN